MIRSNQWHRPLQYERLHVSNPLYCDRPQNAAEASHAFCHSVAYAALGAAEQVRSDGAVNGQRLRQSAFAEFPLDLGSRPEPWGTKQELIQSLLREFEQNLDMIVWPAVQLQPPPGFDGPAVRPNSAKPTAKPTVKPSAKPQGTKGGSGSAKSSATDLLSQDQRDQPQAEPDADAGQGQSLKAIKQRAKRARNKELVAAAKTILAANKAESETEEGEQRPAKRPSPAPTKQPAAASGKPAPTADAAPAKQTAASAKQTAAPPKQSAVPNKPAAVKPSVVESAKAKLLRLQDEMAQIEKELNGQASESAADQTAADDAPAVPDKSAEPAE